MATGLHPLQKTANFSVNASFTAGWLTLLLLYISGVYEASFLFKLSLSAALATIVCILSYAEIARGTPWADNAFQIVYHIIFIPVILAQPALNSTLDSSTTLAPLLKLTIEGSYLISIIFAAICVNALNFRSDIKINRDDIPWTVDIAGLVLFIIGASYAFRFLTLYYWQVPLYKNAGIIVIFTFIFLISISISYFGKYGPLYRNTNHKDFKKTYTRLGLILITASLVLLIFPMPHDIAKIFHFTEVQYRVTNFVNRAAASVEFICCIVLIFSMQWENMHNLLKRKSNAKN